MERDPEPHVLVLGIGNVLMQDEGLGVRAVERLQERYHLPPEVRAIDGGVMGLELLPYLEDAERVLILDAVRTDRPPGSVIRLEEEDIPVALALKTSLHQVGLQEVLAVGRFRGTLPAHITLWGMEPATIEVGTDLSPWYVSTTLAQLWLEFRVENARFIGWDQRTLQGSQVLARVKGRFALL